MTRRRTTIWILIAVAGAAAVVIVFVSLHYLRPRWSAIQGAVVRRDTDTRKQSPIADAVVAATHGDVTVTTKSDANGYFKVTFPGPVLPGTPVTLTFRHPDYEVLKLEVPVQFRSSLRQLVVAAMTPSPSRANPDSTGALSFVSNMSVRYTVNSQTDENIGSAIKTFQVVNSGDVPCNHHAPCSPDGYWKATAGSADLDAGAGNEFRDARVSCIAGPCPFTRIDPRGLASGSRTITASAIDWSDTATFLLEAEVFHTEIISNVRELYPVAFGRTLSFTLPPTAEGVSLQAELNGVQIVFPLGPDLYLSWANCATRESSGAEKSTVYQCELKPGYKF